jgi:hypothetical protein
MGATVTITQLCGRELRLDGSGRTAPRAIRESKQFNKCERGTHQAKRQDMQSEGLDPDRLLAEVRETPWGGDILARFAQLADG